VKEGDEVLLRFDDVAPRGDAIATTGADKPVFAAAVVPGETARVEIRKIRRNWIAVDVLEIVDASPHRVQPRCPLFSTCAGCQLQHVAYPHQLELKRTMVRKQIAESSGRADWPIREVLGAPDPWHYRNHARFTVQDGKLGFVRRFRRQWFEVPHCDIMDLEINALMRRLHGRLTGATQCNIRVGAAPPAMVQPRLDIPQAEVPSGQPHLVHELHGARFRVSAPAFFQVHRAQAERLVDLVAEAIGEAPNAVVLDAYAGVGTFAILLAPRFGRVVAIEQSGPAIDDAKVNLAGADASVRDRVELRLGDATQILGELADAGIAVDAVILDPPRSGCHPAALQAVERLAPKTLVYVSCHPASLGRDLARLCDPGEGRYDIDYIQPLDMFPQTQHVECVAALRRRAAP
jgi:23S rRNA (uracil1939-C5)-methyltransferase